MFAELPTDTAAAHIWPWILFGILWTTLNMVRILYLHRASVAKAGKEQAHVV